LIRWYQNDQIKNNEKGRGYLARTGKRRGAYILWWRDLRGGDHLQGLGVGWRIILVDLKISWEKTDWIDLAQRRG